MEEKKDVQNIELIKKKENVTNQTPQRDGSKEIVTALIVIICILVLGLVYMVFFYNKENKEPVNKKDNVQETKNNTNSEKEETKEEEKKEDKEEKKYNLTVYYYDTYDTLCLEYNSETCKRKAFTIETTTKDARLLAVDGNTFKSFILYSDNGIKIYDVKKKTVKNLNLKDEYKDYEINASEDESRAIGVSFIENNYVGYYNVALGKKLYDKKYKVKGTGSVYQVNDKYISVQNDDYSYLLSCEKEEVKLTHKNEESVYGYSSMGSNGKYLYTLSLWYTDASDVIEIYTNSFQLMMKKNYGELDIESIAFIDNYAYILDNGFIKKYDINGNLLNTSKKYSNIKLFANKYIVYVSDGNLILEKYLNDTEQKVLTKWNEDWYIDSFDSGYYDRKSLDTMDEKNKKEGFYVVIDYNGKDSKGNYGIEYCYTPDKQIIEYPIKQEIGGRAKPVLYLYPEKETNVTITFAHPEYLTTTYPKYIKSWNVVAKPNGDLYDKDGKYYYALYWDEKRYNEVDFHEGFYVESKDAIKFLEEKLSLIGLNDKERNEFIMYWLPIMEKNNKNLVYFELTEEREAGNKLIISPKPDSLLRVSIHIKKVNKKVDIKEQKLETFKRGGFTVVEWGGMTY